MMRGNDGDDAMQRLADLAKRVFSVSKERIEGEPEEARSEEDEPEAFRDPDDGHEAEEV